MDNLQDSNRNGLTSQMVRRISDNEEFVRKHKMLKHQYYAANPLLIYAHGGSTTISTSGQTNVFSITMPASFLVTGHLWWRFGTRTEVTTARTLTMRTIVGGTTIITYAPSITLNSVWLYDFNGTISRKSANVQNVRMGAMYSPTPGTDNVHISYGTGAKTDTSTMTVAVTAQLSGVVTEGIFESVEVWAFTDATVW